MSLLLLSNSTPDTLMTYNLLQEYDTISTATGVFQPVYQPEEAF